MVVCWDKGAEGRQGIPNKGLTLEAVMSDT